MRDPEPEATASCPICGTPSHTVLRRFTVAQAAQAHMPRALHGERHLRLRAYLRALWRDRACEVRHCGACEFGFSHPFTGGDATFYGLVKPDTSYPAAKWEFTRTRDALAALPAGSYDLLEVGAGKGHFVRLVLGLGWPRERIMATEYSPAGLRALRDLGVACSGDDVRRLGPTARFDVVCLFQVLEHLGDLEGFFAALDRMTRPGAHVFIAVPNGAWIENNEARGLLLDMPPNHVSRWRPATFARLADRFGWRLQACELEPTKPRDHVRAAFLDRFVRLSQRDGSWASRVAGAAGRVPSRRLGRLVKLSGALVSPACWRAAFTPVLEGNCPANIWVHLSRG